MKLRLVLQNMLIPLRINFNHFDYEQDEWFPCRDKEHAIIEIELSRIHRFEADEKEYLTSGRKFNTQESNEQLEINEGELPERQHDQVLSQGT